jgi:hypothetical protein
VLPPRVPVSLMTGLLLSGWGLCVLTRQHFLNCKVPFER